MSDDNDTSNIGATLPDNESATYSTWLSPLFITSNGRGSVTSIDLVTLGRGNSATMAASTTKNNQQAYRMIAGSGNIWPSSANVRVWGSLSLRCLVSTNNRIIINLVSDDDKNGDWTTNRGVTLPNGVDATYNASLSPLFIVRSGRIRIDTQDDNIEEHVSSRGSGSYSLSRVIFGLYWSYGSHYLSAGTNVQPSDRNAQTFVFPLRCLVSTNNG